MKTLFIYFILLSALCLQSCKDDPIGPGSGDPPVQGNDSLLFEKDSLIIFRNTFSLDSLSLSCYWSQWNDPDTNIKKIKISFIAETNFDSISGIQMFEIRNSALIHGNFYHFVIQKIGKTEINKNHSFIFDPPEVSYFIVTEIRIIIYQSLNNSYKFLRLKNIKIFKIS